MSKALFGMRPTSSILYSVNEILVFIYFLLLFILIDQLHIYFLLLENVLMLLILGINLYFSLQNVKKKQKNRDSNKSLVI